MKNNILKIAAVGFSMLTLSLAACSGSGSDNASAPSGKYSIGDTGPSGVGTVFYITSGGLHGLEVAPSGWSGGSSDPTSVWSNIDSSAIGSSAEDISIGSGLSNSNAIIDQLGHTSSAAKLCRDYRGGGKTDWFLPSSYELNELYYHRDSNFASDYYWSSTESTGSDSARYAQTILFTSTGGGGSYIKSAAHYVRPVRAF
jgi:hypothetical protein